MTCNVSCQFQTYYDDHRTNFTCSQLIDYCYAYETWMKTENAIASTVNVSLLLAGCGGFVSYILMVIVFRLPDFNGASYIYHKSIVAMELVHMFVMGAVGWHRQFIFSKTYSYVMYKDLLRELWIIGDAMKLSASMVTTFLSMERFIAIWYPTSFVLINKPKVARAFIVLSFFIGLLHISPPFAFNIEPRIGNGTEGLFVAVPKTQGVHIGGDEVVSDIIYAVKIVTSVAMIIFCVSVALGLILKSRKTDSMNSTARTKWKENRRLSILQIVIATLQIIDHLFWVVNNIILDKQPQPFLLGHEKAVTDSSYTYETAMYAIKYRALWRWTFALQEVSGELDHATRLPLYFVGMKKFKAGFLALFGKKEAETSAFVLNLRSTTIAKAAGVAPVNEALNDPVES